MDRLIRTGRDLYLRGLVSTKGGNLSVRDGETVLITRTGAPLGRLGAGDIVDPHDRRHQPSSDLAVHLAIYETHPARAVVHAHGVETTTLSLLVGVIRPVDHEGRSLLPEVTVLDEAQDRADLGRRVAQAADGIAVVRGHGTYAWGDSPEDAEHRTTALEMSAGILLRLEEGRSR